MYKKQGGGATRPLPRDGGAEEVCGDPTVSTNVSPPHCGGVVSKGVGRKFSRVGQRKKIPKIGKKYQKIAVFILFQGGKRKKTPKIAKNSTFKPLYLLYLYHVWKSRETPMVVPAPLPSGGPKW